MTFHTMVLSSPAPMNEKTFRRFSDFIQRNVGIKMPATKVTMLQSRLLKRLRFLRMNSYEHYCDYVFSNEGKREELQHMIDLVTTNKTEFFREPKHFEFLSTKVLPDLFGSSRTEKEKRIDVWSAGCSTGQEPYTLAMVLSEFARRNKGFRYSILATDLSLRVLKKAHEGIYQKQDVEPVSAEMKKRYLLRSKDRTRNLVRVTHELRSTVRFCQLNFMSADYGLNASVDAIFFRNVMIYFNRRDQASIVRRLFDHLNPGGYFFVGHSETLNGLNLPLVPVANAVYRKPA